ncbi:MAG TPA: hypothetical protein VD970_06435, partial [Acetobacteraceae bacterium]|nr:hypothetical protein [Acetobacteraceae bacterium]
IFGSSVDETMNGRIRVSVVATGIDVVEAREAERPRLVAVGGGAAVAAVASTPVPSAAPATAIPLPTNPAMAQRAAASAFIRRAAETGAPVMRGPAVVAPVEAPVEPAPMTAPAAEAPILLTPAGPMAAPEPAAPSVGQRAAGIVGGLFRRAMGPSLLRRDLPTHGAAAAAAPRHAEGPAAVAPQPDPEQPRLAPRPTMQEDGKLEIPAFLRRQSN